MANDVDPRAAVSELLGIPHDQLSEVTYRLNTTEVPFNSGVNILERLREIPQERITQLVSKVRVEPWDPLAKDCWSDHYSQKDPNGWSDKFRNQCGSEVSLDRIPGLSLDRLGPGFERRG